MLRALGHAGWFRMLMTGKGATPKLLLGVVMGFLPCGLVYAMLTLAATMPGPMQGAGAMLAFGVGTLPALSAALLAGNLVPASWRAHGSRLAAVLIILAGGWMLTRALLPQERCHDPALVPALHAETGAAALPCCPAPEH